MNKKEFIDQVAEKTGLSKIEVAKVLEAVITSIHDGLKQGESITMIGLGTFETHKRPARIGRNPRTGEAIRIDARNVPLFRAGKGLKDSVR